MPRNLDGQKPELPPKDDYRDWLRDELATIQAAAKNNKPLQSRYAWAARSFADLAKPAAPEPAEPEIVTRAIKEAEHLLTPVLTREKRRYWGRMEDETSAID